MEKSFYKTSDLGLASALSLFYPIESINRRNPKKIEFVFPKDRNLEIVVERYWRKDLKADLKSFYINLKDLKNTIYNE